MLLGFRVMHLYYYGVLSGVLSSPSFYVNTTNIARYNNRKGGDWEQTLRTVDCNNLSSKGLSGRNDRCEIPCLCFSFAVRCAAGFCMKGGNHTICFKAFQLLGAREI